jgi:hypothetical protein
MNIRLLAALALSWVNAPSQCLPETGSWTFTRSVLDFVKKFVK